MAIPIYPRLEAFLNGIDETGMGEELLFATSDKGEGAFLGWFASFEYVGFAAARGSFFPLAKTLQSGAIADLLIEPVLYVVTALATRRLDAIQDMLGTCDARLEPLIGMDALGAVALASMGRGTQMQEHVLDYPRILRITQRRMAIVNALVDHFEGPYCFDQVYAWLLERGRAGEIDGYSDNEMSEYLWSLTAEFFDPPSA